jgi:hypothetical protein
LAIGQDPTSLFQANKAEPVAVRLITSEVDGILRRARFPEDIDRRPEVLEYTLDVEEDSHVKAFNSGAHRFGHVICRGSDWKDAERNAEAIIETLNLEVVSE